MGNTLPESTQPSLLAEVGQFYTQIKRESRGTVLLHSQTEMSYLLKEYTYSSEQVFQSKLRSLQQQIRNGVKEYIVSPVRVQSKVFNNFCSTSFKIYAIFEYPQVTLKQEIQARQKEIKNFQETQLWSILQSCTNALSELRPLVTLNSSEIFINPDGHLKIIHDDLVDQNYRAIITNHINYAPQKLKSFNRMDTELAMRKETIFSMGMTLLEAAQLAPVANCYDYFNGTFSESELNQILEGLNEKYSPEFIEVLCNILEVNPNRRASLMEVQKMLDSYWGSEIIQEPCEKTDKSRQSNVYVPQQPEREVTLCEKNSNTIAENSHRKSQKLREKQFTLPDEISSYKLQKPILHEPILDSLITPKNPSSFKQNNLLYTDPKLLEMIRQDLEDINKLKQSAFYQTGKYSYAYPETQSIISSVNSFQKDTYTHESKMKNSQFNEYQQPSSIKNHRVSDFRQIKTEKSGKQIKNTEYNSQHISQKQTLREQAAPKIMMKKNNKENTVFTIETYENGRRYEGMTLNGKKHGSGKLIFEDGAYYEGLFKQDKMTGKGVLYYGMGYPAYDGEWLNDQFHGYGILYNQTPVDLQEMYDFRDFNEVDDYWIKYEGEFVLDNKSGQGKLELTNGQLLVGEFKQDFIEGEAQYLALDGTVINGIWQKNILTSIIQQQ